MKKPCMPDFPRRFLAGLLCLVMVLSILPLNALAEDAPEPPEEAPAPETVAASEPAQPSGEAAESAASQEQPVPPADSAQTQETTAAQPQETTGESTEETTGEPTEETTGEPTEETTGEPTEETTGESTEGTTGEPTEETTGESTEETTGESTVETTGESTEETTGELIAQTTAQPDEETTEETTEEVDEEFPVTEYFYTDSMGRSVCLQGQRLPEDGISLFSTRGSYSSVEEAAAYLRGQMEARNTEVVLTYLDPDGGITDSNWNDIEEEIFFTALAHTGVPTQGDYLRWHWGPRRGAAASYTSTSVTITFSIDYYTTASQEDYVASRISQELSFLDLAGKSDYGKILEVYRFVCSNVAYDYTHLNDSDYTLKFSAYAALANGTAVCQGYSLLIYRMLLTLGIDCRLIAGTGKGGAHAWNIARVNGLYYNMDATWDAGKEPSFSYFLCSDANFPSHTRSSDSAGLNYSSGDFYARYPMGAENAVDDPSAPVASGSFGSGLTWSLDRVGTLTLSGTGPMESFSSGEAAPWRQYAGQITQLVVSQGITSVAGNAFPDCSALTGVTLPQGLTDIAENAFSGCTELARIGLPDSLTAIGECAFSGCVRLTDLSFPGNLADIGARAFADCTGLATLSFLGSAPRIDGTAFSGVQATVYYPMEDSSWGSLIGQDFGGALTWPDAYPITYVLNGGVNSPDNPDTYSPATVPVTLQDPTWAHHDFLGWYSDPDLTKKVTGLTAQDIGGKTFYAGWADILYTVSWISEGSVYATDSVLFGQEITAPAENPEKASDENCSYLFAGWASQEEGAVLTGFPSVSGSVRYYAVYTPTPRIYSLRYLLNGGVNHPDNPAGYPKGLYTDLAEPTRAGFRFDGWYTGRDYTQPISQLTPEHQGDMTLYARWVPEVTAVVYDLNAPSALFSAPQNNYANPVQLSINQKPVTLKAPGSVTGYQFQGWERDGKLVTAVGYDPSGSITLTARWEAVPYAITYKNVPAGAANPNPAAYTVEGLTLEGLVLEGYEFAGWYTDSALKKPVSGFAPKTTGSKTLYAKLTGHTYYIRFDPNGGQGTMKDLKTQYGKKVSLSANACKRPGYSFLGWNTQPDGSGSFYADKASVQSLSTAEGSVVTLYAQWAQTGSSYTICFDPNGGQGAMADKTASYGNAVTLPANTCQRPGYTFAGWNTQADGSGKACADKAKVTNLLSGWSPEGSNRVTLYAQWKSISYKITYTLNGGKNSSRNPQAYTVESGKLPLFPAVRTNYTFLGWSLDKSTPTFISSIDGLTGKNLTLYAMWSADAYTVSYDPNGGSGAMTPGRANWGASWTLAANAFTRPGYQFLGWNTQPDGSGAAYSNKSSVKNLPQANQPGETESVVLYAQWVSNTYTIHFDANGGTGTTRDLTAARGKAYTLPACGFARTGYTFLGWSTRPDGSGKTYADKAKVKDLLSSAATQITLYARWAPNRYTLIFDPNGGTGTTAAMVNVSRTKSVALTANGFARTGYTFAGWNTQPDGSGKTYADKAKVKALCTDPQGVVTLYAQWKLKTYKVTYKLNSGKNAAANPTGYTVLSDSITLAPAVRSGYTFLGWYTASGTEVTQLPAGYRSNLTLYARWRKS